MIERLSCNVYLGWLLFLIFWKSVVCYFYYFNLSYLRFHECHRYLTWMIFILVLIRIDFIIDKVLVWMCSYYEAFSFPKWWERFYMYFHFDLLFLLRLWLLFYLFSNCTPRNIIDLVIWWIFISLPFVFGHVNDILKVTVNVFVLEEKVVWGVTSLCFSWDYRYKWLLDVLNGYVMFTNVAWLRAFSH